MVARLLEVLPTIRPLQRGHQQLRSFVMREDLQLCVLRPQFHTNLVRSSRSKSIRVGPTNNPHVDKTGMVWVGMG
jgi:hypothetical protein